MHFPYISNIISLYKGAFSKTSLCAPLPPIFFRQTKVFLTLWTTLHTNKVAAMLPPPKIFAEITVYIGVHVDETDCNLTLLSSLQFFVILS